MQKLGFPKSSWKPPLLAATVLGLIAPACLAQHDRGVTSLGRDPAEAATPGRTWALLVGIDRYNKYANLKYCAADAIRLARALTDHAGYDSSRVSILTDENGARISRGDFIDAFDSFLANPDIGPEDTVLIAFAGHGDVHEERGFLVAGDSLPNRLSQTAIEISWVHEQLRLCKATKKILILDACHSGGERGVAKPTIADLPPTSVGFVELMSCSKDQVSLEDPDLGHGVFTHYLIQAIEGEADSKNHGGNADDVITVDEVYSYVHQKVAAHSWDRFKRSQTPCRNQMYQQGAFVLARVQRPITPEELRSSLRKWVRQVETAKNFGPQAREIMEAILLEDDPYGRSIDMIYALKRGEITEKWFLEFSGRFQTEKPDRHVGQHGRINPEIAGRIRFLAEQIEIARASRKSMVEISRAMDLANIYSEFGLVEELKSLALSTRSSVRGSNLDQFECELYLELFAHEHITKDPELDALAEVLAGLAEKFHGTGSQLHQFALETWARRLQQSARYQQAGDAWRRIISLSHGENLLNASDIIDDKTVGLLPREGGRSYRARIGLAECLKAVGGFREAQQMESGLIRELTRRISPNHPVLQVARQNLAATMRLLGDLPGAYELQAQVLAICSKTLPDDHHDLQTARLNLAITRSALGDLPGALALQEQVFAIRSRTLPDDHPDLQKARQSLAATKYSLGDLSGALALQERVFAIHSKVLADDHPDLQATRQELAVTKAQLGDLQGALALQEQVFAIRSKTLPDDHPDLQVARLKVASTRSALGDPHGALALQEQVFASVSRTLPDDHPDLQSVRRSLARTKFLLGDFFVALALQEKVYAVYSRILPEEHPDFQKAQLCLADTRFALGDLRGAVDLQEKAYLTCSKTLPDDHPDLQAVRRSLANTRFLLGDLQGALALQEQVFAISSGTLPDDHPDLQQSRLNLASTKFVLGDLSGALSLREKVCAIRSLVLPEDHPNLQAARLQLANSMRANGDLHKAAQLSRTSLAGAMLRLSSARVSSRDVAGLAAAATECLSHVGTILDASVSAKPEQALSADLSLLLARDALALLVATQSAQERTTSLLRTARLGGPPGLDELSQTITKANTILESAIGLPPGDRIDWEGRRISREEAILEAALAKDVAERSLLDAVPAELRKLPTTDAISAGLAPDEVAIAFLTYTRWTNDPEKPWIETREQRFAAFVVAPGGSVTWHSLAPVAEIAPLIAAIRKDAVAGKHIATRWAKGAAAPMPGRDSAGAAPESDTLTARLMAIRDHLLKPVLEVLPTETRRLVVSAADEMLLVPFEDLLMADGRTLGEAFEVCTMPSLYSLTLPPQVRTTDSKALIVGSIDYDAIPARKATVAPAAPKSSLVPGRTAQTSKAPDLEHGRIDEDPRTGRFMALPGFAAEVGNVAKIHRDVFSDTGPTLLLAAEASEAAFVEHAPGKTFLHLATHGYFAPESVWGATGARDDGALARFDVGRSDRAAQLSPFSLTGIALAGANLPPDELGYRAGNLTAQEVMEIDLTACHLATLSACNTSLGVRRGGTGLASLRQAFHAAGVRFVLATLWEVNDANAEALMTDFYTRIWKHGEEPRSALRAAKRAARERGVPFRDWAGWMITGR